MWGNTLAKFCEIISSFQDDPYQDEDLDLKEELFKHFVSKPLHDDPNICCSMLQLAVVDIGKNVITSYLIEQMFWTILITIQWYDLYVCSKYNLYIVGYLMVVTAPILIIICRYSFITKES